MNMQMGKTGIEPPIFWLEDDRSTPFSSSFMAPLFHLEIFVLLCSHIGFFGAWRSSAESPEALTRTYAYKDLQRFPRGSPEVLQRFSRGSPESTLCLKAA
ncbi:unnamed protein product [Pleuronectes platessa]|uniref:Uncharacterized protein n=1 Tax=Pleuronectes platessa TaxID=8262 RepID=A0A9N7Z2V8_PLEPL|nr:unnamed protein product [Pleuronectes platessa]